MNSGVYSTAVSRGSVNREIDPHGMFVNKPSPQVPGQRNHPGSQQGKKKPPGHNDLAGLVVTQQPIERRQGKHHDRNQGMAPAIDQPADVLDREQIDHSRQGCETAAKRADPRQPEADPIPERIAREKIADIRAYQPDQCRDREVNQQRVQGVAGNCRPTDDGIVLVSHHGLLVSSPEVTAASMLTGRRRLSSLLILLMTAGLQGCSGSHSILDPASPSAGLAAIFWWAMFIWFSVVLLVVTALWLYAMARKSRTHTGEHSLQRGRRWVIGGGVALPLATIAALLAFGIPLGHEMRLPEEDRALRIDVTGHQWWWEVRYPQSGVVTANQLYMPAGRPVDIHVTGDDVIHSFWVPRLGGKIDMIPGHINVIRLYAEEPGLYHGLCSEFCGLQHAHMEFTVQAQTDEAFASWLQARQEAAPNPRQDPAIAGFQQHCGRCHRVAGISAGREGPDLTDVGSRSSLGAGTLPMTDGAMLRWLREHQSLKPGNLMPGHEGRVPPETLAAIAEWLETLQP